MKSLFNWNVLGVLALTLILTACNKPAEQGNPTTSSTNGTAPMSSAPTTSTNTPAVVPLQPPTNSVATNAASKIFTPLEAKSHVGETATVRGKVFGVHITAKGDAFINVGAAYPGAPFTAVCFQSAIPADDLKKLDGKTVSFTGEIKEHTGTIQIILNTADQITNAE